MFLNWGAGWKQTLAFCCRAVSDKRLIREVAEEGLKMGRDSAPQHSSCHVLPCAGLASFTPVSPDLCLPVLPPDRNNLLFTAEDWDKCINIPDQRPSCWTTWWGAMVAGLRWSKASQGDSHPEAHSQTLKQENSMRPAAMRALSLDAWVLSCVAGCWLCDCVC